MRYKIYRTLFQALAAVLALDALQPVSLNAETPQTVLWIGTTQWPTVEARGIYRVVLDESTGNLTPPELVAEINSPGFLAHHPRLPILYAICQLDEGGGVAAFTKADSPPYLTPLGNQPIQAGGAAHLCVDSTGRCLITAQYGSGSVAIFALADSGAIQPRSGLYHHAGSGPHATRQTSPHPHWVGVSPDNQFLLVPDLGIDQVVIYRLHPDAPHLEPHRHAQTAPGAGPRHLALHPHQPWIYLLNELNVSVDLFRYDAGGGNLESLQTVSALPADERENDCTASEVRVHPTGRFLYTATRGHDTLSVFAIDGATGHLRFVEREPVRGSHPRNFHVSPSGRWLIAAGRDSHTLAVFRVDEQTGGLTFTGTTVFCPAPICVLPEPAIGGP